jgi:hypothetical protein
MKEIVNTYKANMLNDNVKISNGSSPEEVLQKTFNCSDEAVKEFVYLYTNIDTLDYNSFISSLLAECESNKIMLIKIIIYYINIFHNMSNRHYNFSWKLATNFTRLYLLFDKTRILILANS